VRRHWLQAKKNANEGCNSFVLASVRRHWLQAKKNANEGCNSCASLAGLVLLHVLFYL